MTHSYYDQLALIITSRESVSRPNRLTGEAGMALSHPILLPEYRSRTP